MDFSSVVAGGAGVEPPLSLSLDPTSSSIVWDTTTVRPSGPDTFPSDVAAIRRLVSGSLAGSPTTVDGGVVPPADALHAPTCPFAAVAVVNDVGVPRQGVAGVWFVDLHGRSSREAVFEVLAAVYVGILRHALVTRPEAR